MKALTTLLAIIIISLQLFAQDVITLKNNYTIDAKNIVVTPDEVQYQNYYDENEEVHIISKNQVVTILYEDGSKVKISASKKVINQSDIGDNLITFHFLDFVISNFTISYERIIANGKYGIQIPFSFGYSDKPTTLPIPLPTDSEYTNDLVNQFYTGITFNIYPSGQGKVKYFLGPSLRFGSGKYYSNWSSYNSTPNYSINTGYVKFLINNGVIFTFANTLSISVVGSIGIQHMYEVNDNPTQTTGALSVNMSFRFQ
ncbi:MAG: hypothetical protein QM503_12920 [Bacteroidota bacterium]